MRRETRGARAKRGGAPPTKIPSGLIRGTAKMANLGPVVRPTNLDAVVDTEDRVPVVSPQLLKTLSSLRQGSRLIGLEARDLIPQCP